MRRIILILVIVSSIISCNNEPKVIPSAKFAGNIEGLDNGTLILYNKISADTIKTDSVGNFVFDENYSVPTYLNLRIGRKSISVYLKNGYDLKLATTKNNFSKDAKFEGNGKKENNLLNTRNNLAKDLKYFPNIFKLNPDEFLTKSDSIKGLFHNLANEYSNTKDLDSTFLITYNADVRYEQLFYYVMYTPYHKYFTKEELSLPENATNKIENAVIDNDAYLNSEKYIEFLSNALRNRYNEASNEQDSNDISKYLIWLNKELSSQKIKNKLFFNAVRYDITYVSEEDRDKMYSEYSKVNTNKILQQKIDDVYSSFEKLRKGKPAPQWSYPDINGKEFALNDFKGKFVYVDVWATWCGPCKAEIPALAKLAKDYKTKNIVFVSVSVDDNKKAWEKMLKKENFDWIQIHAEKAWKSKIVKENGINGIPRFMLIDKEGNLVNVNAPAPSSDEIRPLFDKLLNQ